ncbi:MAG: hypothetical protein KA802_11165 [Saprospiraceae bacterium]|nr:hypothetical protein [Saprospiraceae bacterium]
MEILENKIKSIKDLEECPYNGKFADDRNWVQIFNLSENGVDFMERDDQGFQMIRVSAHVSNFAVYGRTFEFTSTDKMRKYDHKDGNMLFLQGLYLDESKPPSYSLKFLQYEKGKELPTARFFKINPKDIRFPD